MQYLYESKRLEGENLPQTRPKSTLGQSIPALIQLHE